MDARGGEYDTTVNFPSYEEYASGPLGKRPRYNRATNTITMPPVSGRFAPYAQASAAHEIMHVLGLADRYWTPVPGEPGIPREGFEGELMSESLKQTLSLNELLRLIKQTRACRPSQKGSPAPSSPPDDDKPRPGEHHR